MIYGQESKTLSTVPSLHELTLPSVHSYHQYDTLLHFFTSFLTDFRLHTVELKQLVYGLVGVRGQGLGGGDAGGLGVNSCQFCQVEYMMKSCRELRRDIVNVLALLRGYSCNRSQLSDKLSEIPDVSFASRLENETIENICPNKVSPRQPKLSSLKPIPTEQPSHSFITLRQERIPQKQWRTDEGTNFKMPESNLQFNGKQGSMPVIEEDWHELDRRKSQWKTEEDSHQYYERAYQLIHLLKNEVISQMEAPEEPPSLLGIHSKLVIDTNEKQVQGQSFNKECKYILNQ